MATASAASWSLKETALPSMEISVPRLLNGFLLSSSRLHCVTQGYVICMERGRGNGIISVRFLLFFGVFFCVISADGLCP